MKNTIEIPEKSGQILLILVAILGGIYFIGKSAGKRSAIGVQIPYPKDDTSNQDWSKNIAPSIAAQLHDAMGFWKTADSLNVALLSIEGLSDNNLRYVYNLYNSSYQAGNSTTLVSDLKEQFLFFAPKVDTLRDKMVGRFERLGMK